MKTKLAIAFLIVATACGGSGGTDLFLFRGLWLASLSNSANTCGLAANGTGGVFLEINQRENVVSIFAEFANGTLQGFADGNGFTASSSTAPALFCPDSDTAISNVTSTVEFAGASGDIADMVDLKFFFDCPGFDNQCEVTYSGSAIRLSGSGNTSGEVFQTQTNENPLF